MNIQPLTLDPDQVRQLLASGSGDAALLYLYIRAGNPRDNACAELGLSPARFSCAQAALQQLGLVQAGSPVKIIPGERPSYTEGDVLRADHAFLSLCDEIQRLLGRPINTEERKIILGFVRYLGLPEDVIAMLVVYCKERARQKGSLRNPSLRTIEKEAYAWAERGIDTMEAAAAYIQAQNLRGTRLARLLQTLNIRDRSLTPAEERYAQSWLDMGFDQEALGIAYERTCVNTGKLNWPYMNKILLRWHEAGLHTGEAVRSGDRKPAPGAKNGPRQMDDDEQAAIRRLLQEV